MTLMNHEANEHRAQNGQLAVDAIEIDQELA